MSYASNKYYDSFYSKRTNRKVNAALQLWFGE